MGISDVGDELEGLDEAVARHPASTLEKYADKAMFAAAPMQGSEPSVDLLWMTNDPLGAVAAACRMYEGKVTYDLDEVTNQERAKYWEAMQETHLQAPLEFIEMHFFFENVDRAFTHQLVRQRTAVYAQESLRFGVKEDLAAECSYPPSLSDDHHVFANQSGLNDARDVWNHALRTIQDSYEWLIANGVPAEDARGLLPQCTPTRIHYKTNLRNLLDHAGNRLCTQAQFVWRDVFMKIREAIMEYGDRPTVRPDDAWQFDLIAEGAFVPKCYQQGKCTFDSKLDRGCTIRSRVDAFASLGIPSSEWGTYDKVPYAHTMRIDDEEWLGDPRAAWVQ